MVTLFCRFMIFAGEVARADSSRGDGLCIQTSLRTACTRACPDSANTRSRNIVMVQSKSNQILYKLPKTESTSVVSERTAWEPTQTALL